MGLRFIYYDTETTGLKAESDRIIELAAFDPERGTTYQQLINPGVPIPEASVRICNITDEMVKDAPTFEQVIDPFVQFCEGEVVLVAHNNDRFDIHFLKCEFGRAEKSFPEQWKFLDTLKWSKKYRPDLPSHALQALREVYGFEENNAHRALDDVMMLQQIFSIMIGDLPVETVLDLTYSESRANADSNTMPFGKHKGVPLSEIPSHYVKWLEKSGALDKYENQTLKGAFQKLGILPKKEQQNAKA